MNKVKFLYLIITALAILNVVLLMSAFTPGKGRGPRHEGPKAIIIEKLKLDKEQAEAYQLLIDDHQASIKDKDGKIRALKNSLYDELASNNSVSKPDSLIKELALVQEEVEWIHFKHFKDIKNLCNPDQIILFNSLAAELADLFSGPPKPERKK